MSTPTPPRRRWLRFSLRTLLLAVLLIGSSATLWWNWGPWEHAYTIEEPYRIHKALLSDDGQYILVQYDDANGNEKKNTYNCVDVRAASNGKHHALLRAMQGPDGRVETRGNYTLLQNNGNRWGQATAIPPPVIFDLHTGEELDSKGTLNAWSDDCKLGGNVLLFYREPHSIELFGATIYVEGAYCLSRLPKFEAIRKFPRHGYRARFSDDGRIVRHDDDWVQVFDPTTETETAVPAPSFKMGTNEEIYGDYFCWHPHSTLWIVNMRTGIGVTHSNDSWMTDVSRDGKRIWVTEGETTALYNFGQKLENPIARLTAGSIEFSENETLLLARDGKAFDGKTYSLLWDNNSISIEHFDRRNELILCNYDGNQARILDARTGTTLMDFSSWRLRKYGLTEAELRLSADARLLIARAATIESDESAESRRVVVFRLTRPWQWYGPAYLPEFWLTLVFATGFLWSVWRDRRLGTRA